MLLLLRQTRNGLIRLFQRVYPTSLVGWFYLVGGRIAGRRGNKGANRPLRSIGNVWPCEGPTLELMVLSFVLYQQERGVRGDGREPTKGHLKGCSRGRDATAQTAGSVAFQPSWSLFFCFIFLINAEESDSNHVSYFSLRCSISFIDGAAISSLKPLIAPWLGPNSHMLGMTCWPWSFQSERYKSTRYPWEWNELSSDRLVRLSSILRFSQCQWLFVSVCLPYISWKLVQVATCL